MLISFIFIMSMVLANMTILWFGPWFSAINAFVLIGLDMVLRDKLHDSWKGKNLYPKMLGLITAAAIITFALNPASLTIAIASVSAFVAAMLLDTVVYNFLINKGWLIRSNVSNVGSSLVDSVVFPTIAFGSLMPSIIAMQFFAKVAGGFVWSLVVKKVEGFK